MQEMIVCPTEIRKHIPRLRQIFQTLHEYLIITHEGKPYTSSPPHGTCPHIDDRVQEEQEIIPSRRIRFCLLLVIPFQLPYHQIQHQRLISHCQEKCHYNTNRSGRDLLVIETLEIVVHKVLQQINPTSRIFSTKKKHLPVTFERIHHGKYDRKDECRYQHRPCDVPESLDLSGTK